MVSHRVGIAGVVAWCGFAVLTAVVVLNPRAPWIGPTWPGQTFADSLFAGARSDSSQLAVARALTFLGGDLIATGIVTITAVALLLTRHRALAAYLCASAVGSVAVVAVVKDLVERQRPPTLGMLGEASTWSYPSGHASAGIAVFGALGVVAAALWPTRVGRGVAALAVAIGVAIGLSRLSLGVHWASDVVGGWLLGTAITCTAGWAVLAVVSRQQAAQRSEKQAAVSAPRP